MAWMVTMLFLVSLPLVIEVNMFQSFRQMITEVSIATLTQGAIVLCYFGFIKLYWKPYHGLDTSLVSDADLRRILYYDLDRRRSPR